MVVTAAPTLTLSKSSPNLAGNVLVGSLGGLGALSGAGNQQQSPAMSAGGALPPVGGPLVHQGSLRRRSKSEIAHQVRGAAGGRPTRVPACRACQ